MTAIAKETIATVIPCLRYRDAPAAIDWLCRVFGFERQLVVPESDGSIAHAQLRFGNGMIMLGSVKDTEFGRLMKQPDEIGGAETQCAYVIVADADAIYRRARVAGAEIVMDIKDEDYGGRGFSCRDLEGHLWTFRNVRPVGVDGGTLMKTGRVVALATALNCGLLLLLLLQGGFVAAQPPDPVLRGRALELIDDRGQLRARLNVEPGGAVVLRLLDQRGTIRVKLGADQEGSGLLLANDATEPGVHLLAGAKGSSMRVANKDGHERVITP